jgi:cell division protease FtsH
MPAIDSRLTRRRERLQHKNKVNIDHFLGDGHRVNAVIMLPRYYGELLTWALHRYIEQEGWKIVRTLGYRGTKPVYIDVSTDCDKSENLLMNGQLMLEKGDSHFVVTVDINLRWRNSVQVESPAHREREIKEFIDGIKTIAEEQNFYRGKNIEFGGRLRFLNLSDRQWDSIVLDAQIKREIRANTIDFLNKRKCFIEYGIPQKRGIILAGEPGTGKTVICKALMAEADGITCITTNAYSLDADEYITELYELAQDLSPCIVFIEDIDLIGQNRQELGYRSGPALLSLLAVLDGIEEKKEIVTVATTNCIDILDKAIKHRPSRFDRMIKLSFPSLEQRKELIRLLSQKIPVDEATQCYIARQADNCTPAQLQEIIYSLVIERSDEGASPLSIPLEFSRDDIDSIISKVNGRNGYRLGFDVGGNHNGEYSKAIGIEK